MWSKKALTTYIPPEIESRLAEMMAFWKQPTVSKLIIKILQESIHWMDSQKGNKVEIPNKPTENKEGKEDKWRRKGTTISNDWEVDDSNHPTFCPIHNTKIIWEGESGYCEDCLAEQRTG